MLTTGIRTPVGIKVYGPDLATIERIEGEIEGVVRELPATRSVFAERTAGGYFLDFELRRDRLARYGLSVEDAEAGLLSAVGGDTVTTTIEGRARYGVSVRFPRELRGDVESLKRVLVPTRTGAQVPLAQLADIRVSTGPAMIRNENGMLAGYVYVDIVGSDVGGYVERAKEAVAATIDLPAGWAAGQPERASSAGIGPRSATTTVTGCSRSTPGACGAAA